jgi:hypothetical protein
MLKLLDIEMLCVTCLIVREKRHDGVRAIKCVKANWLIGLGLGGFCLLICDIN